MHIHGIFRPLNTLVGRRDISNKNNISDISDCVSCGVYNALHVYSTQTRRSKGEKWKVLKLKPRIVPNNNYRVNVIKKVHAVAGNTVH